MGTQVTVKELLTGNNRLFSLPDILFQLKEMIHNPDVSLNDIGKVITKEPALTARLLRVVNSPFYGFQSKIDTVTRAITVVGVDDLYNLILATYVVEKFAGIPSEIIDMTDFWMRSVHCGVVAKLLSKHSLDRISERMFITGLLHDIGSLILYQKMPNESREILIATNYDRRLLAELEQERLGFTHADVTCELMKLWGLPASLYEPIGKYLDPDNAAQDYQSETYLLNMAIYLVDSTSQTVPVERIALELSEALLSRFNLSLPHLELIMQQANKDFLDVYDFIGPNKKFH
jgi:HD-like signal output (HDOD) protein